MSVLLPYSNEIDKKRDIIIPYNDGNLHFINALCPAYDCL